MTIELHDYRDGDAVCEAGIARPAGDGPAPAVLVAHQWAGQGPNEHAAAERLAALGYVGIALDVYGKGRRGEPGGDHSALIQPWLEDRTALQRRLLDAVAFARALPFVADGPVAAIGYCFGGLCVLDLARSATPDVAGVVAIHGLLDGNGMDDGATITAKVLVEHGWRDPMAAPDKVLAFAEEMGVRDADWQFHAHGRALHAFTTKGANAPDKGLKYDADADRRSWQSLESFLAEVFGK